MYLLFIAPMWYPQGGAGDFVAIMLDLKKETVFPLVQAWIDSRGDDLIVSVLDTNTVPPTRRKAVIAEPYADDVSRLLTVSPAGDVVFKEFEI